MEGTFSILSALVVWFGLPNDPANAYFFNEEERKMMAIRAALNQQYMGSNKLDWQEVRNAARDPKVYLRQVFFSRSSRPELTLMEQAVRLNLRKIFC